MTLTSTVDEISQLIVQRAISKCQFKNILFNDLNRNTPLTS